MAEKDPPNGVLRDVKQTLRASPCGEALVLSGGDYFHHIT